MSHPNSSADATYEVMPFVGRHGTKLPLWIPEGAVNKTSLRRRSDLGGGEP